MAQAEPTIIEGDITPQYMPPAQPGAPAAPTQDEAAALRRQIEIEKDIKKTTDELADISKKDIASIEEQRKVTDPLYKEAQDLAKQREQVLKETPTPQVPNIPPPPQQAPIDKNTANLMGSIGLIISSLAGFGGRMNGIKMNESLAGFLNGYREGRYEDAEFARRQWHDLFDYQLGLYQMQVDRTKDILQRSGMTLENKVAQINLMKAPFADYQEGLEVRERNLEKILTDLRQEEAMIQRMQDANTRIRQNELRNAIEVQKYNLEVWKATHPNAKPSAEGDKLALAMRQLGLPANTPIEKLTADQAKRVHDLMGTTRAASTGLAAPATKAYDEKAAEEASREFDRRRPAVLAALKKAGKPTDEKSVDAETIRQVDTWLRENFHYKVLGTQEQWFAGGKNFRVAPLWKSETTEGGPGSVGTAESGQFGPAGPSVTFTRDPRTGEPVVK